MPEMPASRRGAGPFFAAIDPTSLLPWINGTFPPIKIPDQSRYGPSPSDASPTLPLRAERWRLLAVDVDGRELHHAIVIGEADLATELADLEARADFGGAIAWPL